MSAAAGRAPLATEVVRLERPQGCCPLCERRSAVLLIRTGEVRGVSCEPCEPAARRDHERALRIVAANPARWGGCA